MIDLEGPDDHVLLAESPALLGHLPAGAFQLVYLDPPFNTGRVRERRALETRRADRGDRVGFGGHAYTTRELGRRSYADSYEDYLAFLGPCLEEAHRLLSRDGTLYLHLDYREAHYCKVALDGIFGRGNFLNEIVWAYDYGGRPRNRWPAKHDTILVYVKDVRAYRFDREAVERIPYMAPGLVPPEKAARGKLPTDVWWHTIVPTNGREKTGYPTQKPEGILRRIVQASSAPGSWVLDFFAGSGTTGAVARAHGRRFVLADRSEQALDVIRSRLGDRHIRYSRFPPLP